MRKIFSAAFVMVLVGLSLAGTAAAQDDNDDATATVIGIVTSDPATVPVAGQFTLTASGSDFVANTTILLVSCVSPADTLVPGVSDFDDITAAAVAIDPLVDCDVGAAQAVDVDGDGEWTAELIADVGDNFFLSAGALDGSQAGATWVAIVPEEPEEVEEEEVEEEEVEDEAAEDEAAEDEAPEEAEETTEDEEAEEAGESDELPETGVETSLLAVIGISVLGAGTLFVREVRRLRP